MESELREREQFSPKPRCEAMSIQRRIADIIIEADMEYQLEPKGLWSEYLTKAIMKRVEIFNLHDELVDALESALKRLNLLNSDESRFYSKDNSPWIEAIKSVLAKVEVKP